MRRGPECTGLVISRCAEKTTRAKVRWAEMSSQSGKDQNAETGMIMRWEELDYLNQPLSK